MGKRKGYWTRTFTKKKEKKWQTQGVVQKRKQGKIGEFVVGPQRTRGQKGVYNRGKKNWKIGTGHFKMTLRQHKGQKPEGKKGGGKTKTTPCNHGGEGGEEKGRARGGGGEYGGGMEKKKEKKNSKDMV